MMNRRWTDGHAERRALVVPTTPAERLEQGAKQQAFLPASMHLPPVAAKPTAAETKQAAADLASEQAAERAAEKRQHSIDQRHKGA